jgi:dTDP-4-amino-4,6-dideoxygalactose transaminase
LDRIFLSPPHMGKCELRFIEEAFKSNYIAPLGPMVDAFEQEFAAKIGIPYALAVSSGTAAMHLALRVLGVSSGDEILASSLTFIGSVSPILFQGAIPVFIDSELTSWNMDPVLLEQELNSLQEDGRLPKALVPTDLYGQCCDYAKILPICAKFCIPVVVDAAEALGARFRVNPESGTTDFIKNPQNWSWKHAGTGAKCAVFSFNGNKIITTSGGGMLVSEEKDLIEEARFLSQQARDPFPHYEHSTLGYNYRMSNILAAIGRGQLLMLDDKIMKKRQIFDYYYKALKEVPGIQFMPEPSFSLGTRWLTVLLVNPKEFGADREIIRLALEKLNIESRPVWKPMHLQPIFDINNNFNKLRLSNNKAKTSNYFNSRIVGGETSERIFKQGLCLPSGTNMSKEDLDRVIDPIIKLHGRVK